jgi:hypothetical protein
MRRSDFIGDRNIAAVESAAHQGRRAMKALFFYDAVIAAVVPTENLIRYGAGRRIGLSKA